jgi:hypothetical protein
MRSRWPNNSPTGVATAAEVRRAQEDAKAALREFRERDTLSFSKEFLFLSAPERTATHILSPDVVVVSSCGCDVAYCLDFFGDPVAGALQATWDQDEVVLLRDLFGNPFRPIVIEPSWLTPTTLSLARAAYDRRQFPCGRLDAARLAILADALEEAGAVDAGLLD